MDNINISNTDDRNAISFTGTSNTLNLIGTNTILSSNDIWGSQNAIIHAGGNTELTINAAAPSGSLNVLVKDGQYGNRAIDSAAIGGNGGEAGGKLTIAGGNILVDYDLEGAISGAGIGGGSGSRGGEISISGGNVTVKMKTDNGETGGAAIGGGSWGGSSGTINISGGNVTVDISRSSYDINGAGIGGGTYGDADDITISGGNVKVNISGAINNGAGIGGGQGAAGSNLNISGNSNVTVSGGGIGGGSGAVNNGNITLSGNATLNADKINATVQDSSGKALNEIKIELQNLSGAPVSFPANTTVSYKAVYNDSSELSGNVVSDKTGALSIFLHGGETDLEITFGGKTYTGTANITSSGISVVLSEVYIDTPAAPKPGSAEARFRRNRLMASNWG